MDSSKRETVIRILQSRRDEESEKELVELMGLRLTTELLTKLKTGG